MKFEKTREYVYANCIKRVEKRFVETNIELERNGEAKLFRSELYPENESVVSYFFNGQITCNNPYLITPKLMGTPNTETGIIPMLNFKTAFEVLWGDENEFDQRIEELLKCILLDIRFTNKRCSELEIIEMTLCDHISYAFRSTFAYLKETYQISSTLEYFGILDTMITNENIKNSMNNAVAQLLVKKRHYNNNGIKKERTFREEFKRSFENFAKKRKDYKFFDRRLEEEFMPVLVSLFEKYQPEKTSLGVRIKWLIENEVFHGIELKNNPDLADTLEHRIKRDVVSTSTSYIVKLQELADKYKDEGVHL